MKMKMKCKPGQCRFITPTVEDFHYNNKQVCIHCGTERWQPVKVVE